MKPYLKTVTGIICWLVAISAFAQKLPAVQPVSLYAPNHKAGSLLAALDNKFKAYNKGNHIYYTIANDDNNLYLCAYTTDKLTIQKIVRWGLALTVDRTKKIGPGSPAVSFPVPDRDKNYSIIRKMGSDVPSKTIYNTKMASMCKIIALKNLVGLADPTISVYNTEGIKAMALFNDKLEYTYELTVPLKYLNIPAKDKTSFHYNIKLNGAESNVPPGGVPVSVRPMRKDGRSNYPNLDYLDYATDFSGTCMLAAK